MAYRQKVADLSIVGGSAGTLTEIQINGTPILDDSGQVNITAITGDNAGQIKIGG